MRWALLLTAVLLAGGCAQHAEKPAALSFQHPLDAPSDPNWTADQSRQGAAAWYSNLYVATARGTVTAGYDNQPPVSFDADLVIGPGGSVRLTRVDPEMGFDFTVAAGKTTVDAAADSHQANLLLLAKDAAYWTSWWMYVGRSFFRHSPYQVEQEHGQWQFKVKQMGGRSIVAPVSQGSYLPWGFVYLESDGGNIASIITGNYRPFSNRFEGRTKEHTQPDRYWFPTLIEIRSGNFSVRYDLRVIDINPPEKL